MVKTRKAKHPIYDELWIATYWNGQDNDYLLFVSDANNRQKAEEQFKKDYRIEYDKEIDDADIISLNQIINVYKGKRKYDLHLVMIND